MKFAIPRLYLGTMTFGWSQTSSYVDESVALEMLRMFIDFNNNNNTDTDMPIQHFIDTARIYAGGKTEEMLGQILWKQQEAAESKTGILHIGTKAHPSQPFGLSSKGIRTQIQASLDAMQLPTTSSSSSNVLLDEYYLHQPDTDHSLLESLQEAHQLVLEGMCMSIGMSNYHVSEMERAFALCDEYQLTKPSVYQGLYNPLNRQVETKLLPLLKQHGCRFIAYNPLAAGLLTGKHDYNRSLNKQNDKDDTVVVANGRFKDNPNYLPRFYTKQNFKALSLIQTACEQEGISIVEATYRWLLRHSALDATTTATANEDGILLGASSISQLRENLNACQAAINKGPLSVPLLHAFDEAWNVMQNESDDDGGDGPFPYWRSYSSDMPNRNELDQGASYAATKK